MKKIITIIALMLFTLAAVAQKTDSTKVDSPTVQQPKLYYFQFSEDYANAILHILQNSDESHKVVTMVLNAFVYELQHQPIPVTDTTHKAVITKLKKVKK